MPEKKITDFKLSEIIRACHQGLEQFSQKDNFRITMSTYGYSDSAGMCFGCLATCALQNLCSVEFGPENINSVKCRADSAGFFFMHMGELEKCLDRLRYGHLDPLCFLYFDVTRYVDLPEEIIVLCDEFSAKINLSTVLNGVIDRDNFKISIPIFQWLETGLVSLGY